MSKRLKVLFISGELIAGDLAYRLKKEGCDVRLYIEDKSRKDCLDGMVDKTDDWKKELKWVGRDGLIVFDDVGYGKIQDELRKDGYRVFGGSEGGDRLEQDRQHGQEILSSCGIEVARSFNFNSLEKAVSFVRKNKGRWVIKQDGHKSFLNYVGALADGADVLGVLENHLKHNADITSIHLQEKIEGIEIGVGRYFNGNDWIGPVEMNIEHKGLFNGGIGPKTGEMGTLMWYDDKESNRLFQMTLSRLRPYLQKIDFRGDIDINCIVNEEKALPLEITARLGCPSTQLQAALHLSSWKEFLTAVARGQKYSLRYRKGFGIVVSVAIPPFPYPPSSVSQGVYAKGIPILFKKELTKDELNRIHFEEVLGKKIKEKERYFVAGSNGYILYVTGTGKTVQAAREQAYSLVDKIVIPKMFYRTDIGLKFIERDRELLGKWGYL